jgi:hypothetical protein
MPNLSEQLRRYGGYLDALDAPEPAQARVRVRVRAERRAVAPRLAWGLASAAGAVLLVGTVVAVTADGGSEMQATRTPEATRAAESPAAASDRTLQLDADAGGPAAPSAEGTAPSPAVVEQRLRDALGALGACPALGEARAAVRAVAGIPPGVRVRVDADSSGPCVRLRRVAADLAVVRLERFRSTP